MKEVIIIGSGAVAAEVCSYIEDINQKSDQEIKVIGFIDDSYKNFTKNSEKYQFDKPYLGSSETYDYKNTDYFIFGFSNISARLVFLDKTRDLKLKFLTIIHPTAVIAKTARIGNGNIINPYCIVGPNATIGDHNILTSYSFVSHDCIVGSNNFFSTAGLSGDVTVGDHNFFGIRVTILPSICIGNHNIIQAGMTIDKDISSCETVFYRYREKIMILTKEKN